MNLYFVNKEYLIYIKKGKRSVFYLNRKTKNNFAP